MHLNPKVLLSNCIGNGTVRGLRSRRRPALTAFAWDAALASPPTEVASASLAAFAGPPFRLMALAMEAALALPRMATASVTLAALAVSAETATQCIR